jgi:hypothetical protein
MSDDEDMSSRRAPRERRLIRFIISAFDRLKRSLTCSSEPELSGKHVSM